MKKILLILFALYSNTVFSQNDKLILVTGDTLNVSLTLIGVKEIKYTNVGDDLNYLIKKNKVIKIIHDSGKVDIINTRLANKLDLNINTYESKTQYVDSLFSPNIEFGFLYGGSHSIITGINSPEDYGTSRYPLIEDTYGIFAQYNISNTFSLKTKLMRHVKGENWDDNEWSLYYNEVWLEYIVLPVLAEFNFNIKKYNMFLDVGCYFGVLKNAVLKTDIYNQQNEWSPEPPVYQFSKNPYPTFDFGAVLGLGIGYEISDNFRLLIESSIENGLLFQKKTEIFSGRNVNFSIPISLGVAYRISD